MAKKYYMVLLCSSGVRRGIGTSRTIRGAESWARRHLAISDVLELYEGKPSEHKKPRVKWRHDGRGFPNRFK